MGYTACSERKHSLNHLDRSLEECERVEREGRQVDKIHMSVEATIEAKVAEFGRDALGVWTVIAENRNRNGGLQRL